MPRPAKGSILPRTLTDGSRSYRLRFSANGERQDVFLHEQPGCECGCGGGWTEPAARTELGNILARVRAGVWNPPQPPTPPEPPREIPTFHEYASLWLQRKIDGVTGDRPIRPNTAADYRSALTQHLLPYFARHRLDAIDRQACLAFKATKIREATELRDALAVGADLRDTRNRRLVPIGPSQLRKLISMLAMILDDAIEDELIDRNPARGKRMRVRVPKPRRSFLELDELADLIDAAATQDALPQLPTTELTGDNTRARVARLLATGHTSALIGQRLGLAKATVSHHIRGLTGQQAVAYIGRRAVIEILARTGLRVGELCSLRLRDVRLHDPDGARMHIRDAKTDAGIREVQMTPDLVEAFIEHLDRLQRAGQPTGPDSYAIPNQRGGPCTRQRIAQIIAHATTHATARRAERDLPPMPHISPHSLRRTYISIALLANNFDVKWVMSQVGHVDSKMTLDVYAQLAQRIQRDHGCGFDRLLRSGRSIAAPVRVKSPIGHAAQDSTS
jgi:integrase